MNGELDANAMSNMHCRMRQQQQQQQLGKNRAHNVAAPATAGRAVVTAFMSRVLRQHESESEDDLLPALLSDVE